ncbi:hypothetical protein E2650_05460 [Shewanella xiamenensis]|uniref:DUF3180 domain-containing protein n=1 Tax=Shewanella xiamenensis TaxID=332186 RepID=A0AAW6QUL4_9GAMM|nr:hypothetical protein [Shewanella xiamenensis]MDG5899358.1 hypothetical protein [Shewanella xiamenensis]
MSEKTKKQLKTYYAVFAGMSAISTLVLLAWYLYVGESGRMMALNPMATTILFGWSTIFGAIIMSMALFAPIGMWNISVKRKWLEEETPQNLSPQQAEYRSKKLKLQTILASYAVIGAYGVISFMAVLHLNKTSGSELIERFFGLFSGWGIFIATIAGVWGCIHTMKQQKELESHRNPSQESSQSTQVDLDK